ncbi:glycerol-3-phosphate dehydrogenase [NAD(+)], cytoplasmic [Tetranychus urticae]|uniref:Glycerol-3-phosphate dehydrogenase [NAD(+)] n=1 Tax=Tetranychus urticae TaxID=32264 RepID=T1KEE4_TETUR|nr:glycerol-3-phosphate dehydrogenase [NAD(+)], cytoplasmic [Tetranychus urticae]
MSALKKICLIGSGNWGSAIAKIVGHNVTKFDYFDKTVKMYVYEEIVDGRKLTEIINTDHENVKYLPGHKLPETIVAVPDALETAKDADVIIFVVPHQFVERTCAPLKDKIKPSAIGLSLIKGFGEKAGGGLVLISDLISETLGIKVSALMGANLAHEVADEKFCETTIGTEDEESGKILKDLLDTPNFRVTIVRDRYTVEVCGALKNIVGCAAGFSDGLKLGDNSKAAVIRLGLKEMIRFVKTFYGDNFELSTFFESCGVADLITTCYGGRNRKISEAFVTSGKTIEELEKELLNGQRLQGPQTAYEVLNLLEAKNVTDRFPLFYAVAMICKGIIPPSSLIEYLRKEPSD